MKYQLVIQFSEELDGGFDRLIEIEDELEPKLETIAEVDGHDIGGDEMNIFILTDSPIEAFEKIKIILSNILTEIKIAYRDLEDDNFICLHPKEITEFKVL